ncbi:MAG: hypothetical protein ACE5NP_04740 [Anaerolineae bacterium]
MVCRKRTEKRVAYFNEIRPTIEQRIREKLEQFWNEGKNAGCAAAYSPTLRDRGWW